jgi:hypothetical protein
MKFFAGESGVLRGSSRRVSRDLRPQQRPAARKAKPEKEENLVTPAEGWVTVQWI